MKYTFLLLAAITFFTLNTYGQKNNVIYLWPGKVPGETEEKHEPVQHPNTEGNTIRLTDVTNPALIVYPADPKNNNGAGVVVLPGGGYSILSYNKEGTEIAEWLNKLGYTAFVLQYRVPQKQEGALQDLQRALRLIRSQADKWKLNKDKLGVLGFSAGGSLSARASTRYRDQTYTPVDKADSLSSRPDFALLIYPAYLDKGENRSLTPELKVNKITPPMFIFGTADDKYGNSSLVMATALRDADVPVELHLLATGGHGYGMRPGNVAAESWPLFAEAWLKNIVMKK